MNNKNILKKILDEINKDVPRLDYIRGLIEASVEEEVAVPVKVHGLAMVDKNLLDLENMKSDEEIIPEIAKVGPIGRIA